MRKKGKQIKNKIAVMPLGVKRPSYELGARSALLALKHNVHNRQHLADLYSLAHICQYLSNEQYILSHSNTVKNLIDRIYDTGIMLRYDYISMETSAGILLEFFAAQKNTDIARATQTADFFK